MTAVLSRTALALVSILILALTLTPVPGSGAVTVAVDLFALRGAADAVANILLFMPFGVCAALSFRGRIPPVAAALALSVFIEMAQLAVPGRFVSSTDIVFNTAGAALGAWLGRSADRWMNPVGWLRWLLAGGGVAPLAAGRRCAGGGARRPGGGRCAARPRHSDPRALRPVDGGIREHGAVRRRGALGLHGAAAGTFPADHRVGLAPRPSHERGGAAAPRRGRATAPRARSHLQHLR